MGAPPIPDGVPIERVDFLALRAKPGADPNISSEDEWYFTDTGETLAQDPNEFTPSEIAARRKAEADEDARRQPGKSRWWRWRRSDRE